jgi:hypothetical protein
MLSRWYVRPVPLNVRGGLGASCAHFKYTTACTLLKKKPARSHKHLDAHFKDVNTCLHGKPCDAGFTMSFSRDIETLYRSTWWGSRHTEAIFLTNVGEGTVSRRNWAIPNRSRIDKTVFSVVPYFTNGSTHKAQQDVTVNRDASILLASSQPSDQSFKC